MKTKHEMPAITDQEREAAISFCVDEIAHLERCVKAYPDAPVLKTDLVTRKIALAALKAEPVAVQCRYHPAPMWGGSWTYVPKENHEQDTTGKYQEEPLYTAPPVPTMKAVELPSRFKAVISSFEGSSSSAMQLNKEGNWLNRSSVIAAIKAAGGTVEGE